MRVAREEVYKVLASVTPGLAAKEILEQSSCLVFHEGLVRTYNDEISASRKSPLNGVEGAVKAKPLLELLSKMSDVDIDITQSAGSLDIRGKRKKAKIRMEAQVMLPVEGVDVPESWRPLDPLFPEAIGVVHVCASREESQFVKTCVHITADYMEACDKFQIARFPIKMGVDKPILVRAESVKQIVGYGMTEVSETDSWIHFRNPTGLVISIRRYLDEFPDLGRYLDRTDTVPMTLPGGLEEVVSSAEIFSSENAAGNRVAVDMRSNRVVITGEGPSGEYHEMKEVVYSGEPIRFLIAPKLFIEVAKKSSECRIAPGRLFIDGGKYVYVTSTLLPETTVPASEEKSE